MVRSATATAGDDEPSDDDLDAAGRVPVQRGSAIATISQVMDVTGLSESTVRRMIDRWMAGDRSDDALKGGRIGGAGPGRRYADRADAEALAAQIRGELGPDRHARCAPAGDGP